MKIEIKRKLTTMATTSDSFPKDEKLTIKNQNSENEPTEEDKEGPSSEPKRAASVESSASRPPKENKIISVDEAITKVETVLQDLKKQRASVSPAEIRIVRDVSKKRTRKSRKKYSSSPGSSSDSSRTRPDRSPSPKRRRESPHSSSRDSSLNSSDSDRAYSCVSKKLKKELSGILGDSFVSINSKRNARKFKKERSRSRGRNESNSRYTRKDSYERSRERSKRDDSYERYAKRKSSRRNSDRTNNYSANYQQQISDMKERYWRYYAVMSAFSIIMDILRQDDFYSTD